MVLSVFKTEHAKWTFLTLENWTFGKKTLKIHEIQPAAVKSGRAVPLFEKKSGHAVPIWPQGMIKLVTKSWGVKSGRAVPLIIGLMHNRVYKIQSLGVKSGRSVQLVGQRVQFWPQRVGFVSGTVCPVLTPSVQKILDPSVLSLLRYTSLVFGFSS